MTLLLTLIITLLAIDFRQIRLIIDELKDDLRPFLNAAWSFIKDYRNFISYGIAWMITNGWSYVLIILGAILDIKWMKITGETYLAFLWLPCTPEKLITIPLAIVIKKIIFNKGISRLQKWGLLLYKKSSSVLVKTHKRKVADGA